MVSYFPSNSLEVTAHSRKAYLNEFLKKERQALAMSIDHLTFVGLGPPEPIRRYEKNESRGQRRVACTSTKNA